MKIAEKFFFLLSIACVLCGCGGHGQAGFSEENEVVNNATQPVLNENGREEIHLSTSMLSIAMQEIIVDYNKQSDCYEIVPTVFDSNSSFDDQRSRIQLEITSGGGPDILNSSALQNIDMKPYAEAGVLLDVTDYLIGQELVKNVAQANQTGGKIYGIPYAFSINTMVTSRQMATDRENWTKEYCMQTAQDKGAAVFIGAPQGWTKEESGLYVLNVLGVGMGDIQLFVDEEQGICSFDQPEFIELLEFCKKYSDQDTEKTNKGKYASGEIFCTTIGLGNFESFWHCEALFEGQPVYMGYPSPDGGQHQITVESFYINAASTHVEGALDFIQYLLEEEQQRRLVAEGGKFPVQQKLLETLWKEAREMPLTNETGYERGDVSYAPRPMTEEEEEIFWQMLEHPIYYQWQNDIWDIIEEEVRPFFYGDKPAEETAKVIDSRVQIYLDERK